MKTSSTVSISNELIDLNEEDFGNRLITKVAVGEFDPLANRKSMLKPSTDFCNFVLELCNFHKYE